MLASRYSSPPHSIYGNPENLTISVSHHLAEVISMAVSRVVITGEIKSLDGGVYLLGLSKDIMNCLSAYDEIHKSKVELLDRAIAQKMSQGTN